MKIVVLDGYCENPGDLSWEPLKQFGELVVYDRTPEDKDEIIKRIGDADVLVGNKVAITADIMDACKNLKYITVLATGYNVIDVAAAKERGIPVSNVPTYGTAAVAQRAKSLNKSVIAIVGGADDAEIGAAYDMGVTAVFPINRLPQDFSVSRHHSVENLSYTADNIMRLLAAEQRRANV